MATYTAAPTGGKNWAMALFFITIAALLSAIVTYYTTKALKNLENKEAND